MDRGSPHQLCRFRNTPAAQRLDLRDALGPTGQCDMTKQLNRSLIERKFQHISLWLQKRYIDYSTSTGYTHFQMLVDQNDKTKN